LGQPFFNVYGKLSGLVGGPAVALQETNWPIPTSPLQILPNIVGQERNMMKPVEGLKHIAKTTIAPLRGIPIVNLWQEPHPDTRGVGQIPMAYAKRMIGEEPKGLTKAFAIAGGVGAEYLVTPQLVSSTFKGAARLGRATPWYKTWAASRLPKLENLMLEFGADKAEGIEQARELGRTVRKKELIPIAKSLFKTQKPSKSQISAVAKRLKQIEQGGVTARTELAEKAGKFSELWEKTTPTLQKAKLLGKETIFTKLSKARKNELKAKIAELQKQLAKLKPRKFPGRADKMGSLTDKIDDIKLQIWRSEHLGGTLIR
jgi:hypothetical protein